MYNQPFDPTYGDWLSTLQQQQISGNNQVSQALNSHNVQAMRTSVASTQPGNTLVTQPQAPHGLPPPVQLPYQNPYIMQLNQMTNQPRAAVAGAHATPAPHGTPHMGQVPILAWDPNTNPYQLANSAQLAAHQQEMNTIQQMQMLILQEQQALDATLKDEDPNARFKRYQAAYAKILQHQSYGQQANIAQMAATSTLAPQYLNNHQPSLINPLINPLYNNPATSALAPNLLATNPALIGFNPQAAVQMQNISRPSITTDQMDTGSPGPASVHPPVSGILPTSTSQSVIQVIGANKPQTSSGKSGGTDNTSVTCDSVLERSSTSGSVATDDPESLRQSMTNSRAHANRIKEGVVASAAQLTPGLFSNADNIQEFLGLAENPQIHVPCTAKCYHKCKLGISCPRHAHKHHERKIRKQKQAAAAAAAAAAASGNPEMATESASTPSNKHGHETSGSCKGNKSIETSSSMSICSDTFNNLDKKSGKDGKKRTFLDLYEVYNVIGVGGGGMVYSGRRIQDKLPVAIKRVMREKVKRWETVQGYQVPQEIALMLRCYGHPGIIKLVDWYECLDSFILIMERPERAVDLFDYIREIGRVPEKEAARIFKQILDAAIHIQNCGVIHRDIKDENIIINRDTMEAKLIDFGCGTLLKDGPYRDFSGTPEFYPPEWFVDREYYARTACVWSLGVLLFDMTQGEIPFKQKEKIVENKPTYKHPISDHCRNLIQWCMNTNQNSRPSLEQVQCHMWVMLNSIQAFAGHTAALTGAAAGIPPNILPGTLSQMHLTTPQQQVIHTTQLLGAAQIQPKVVAETISEQTTVGEQLAYHKQ